MKKTVNTKFAVFCNRLTGETVGAKDVQDLLDNKMTKRQKEFWSHVEFKDSQNRTIHIHREFLDEGMTIQECISDWVENATQEQLDEESLVLSK